MSTTPRRATALLLLLAAFALLCWCARTGVAPAAWALTVPAVPNGGPDGADNDAPAPLALMAVDLGPAPGAWAARRQAVEAAAPDVFALRDATFARVSQIESDLAGAPYRWIGAGRDGGSRGPFAALFYRADRLAPEAFDHCWLSDTPDTAGSGPAVTWVRFRDRRTGEQVVLWTATLDGLPTEAAANAADLVRRRAGLGVRVVGLCDLGAGATARLDLR